MLYSCPLIASPLISSINVDTFRADMRLLNTTQHSWQFIICCVFLFCFWKSFSTHRVYRVVQRLVLRPSVSALWTLPILFYCVSGLLFVPAITVIEKYRWWKNFADADSRMHNAQQFSSKTLCDKKYAVKLLNFTSKEEHIKNLTNYHLVDSKSSGYSNGSSRPHRLPKLPLLLGTRGPI